MRRTTTLVWLLLSALAASASAQYFRGELTARYRDRWGSASYEDEDLYTYLRLSFWNDEQERELGGAVALRWNLDLQTRANEIDDGNNDLRVYYAYLDVNKVESFDLRLGQQIVDEAEGFQVAGAKGLFKLPWKRARIGLFGGQPVSYYTSVSGDWAGGATFSLQPTRSIRLRGSYVHVEEDLAEDDVVTLAYRQVSPQGWNVYGTARTLNFDVWNELVGGSYYIEPASLYLNGSYRRQEQTNDTTSRYYSSFATTLGPSLPYQRLTLSLNRPFGDWLALGLGWTKRDLLDDPENRGNAEYTQTFFDVYLLERLLAGFEANFNVSRWDSDRNDQTTFAGSISRRVGERLKFDVGTYYAKYEIRRLFDDPDQLPVERYDVRTYYLRGNWRIRGKYRVQLELERGTDDTSADAFYQVELRFGLDLGWVARGFSS